MVFYDERDFCEKLCKNGLLWGLRREVRGGGGGRRESCGYSSHRNVLDLTETLELHPNTRLLLSRLDCSWCDRMSRPRTVGGGTELRFVGGGYNKPLQVLSQPEVNQAQQIWV